MRFWTPLILVLICVLTLSSALAASPGPAIMTVEDVRVGMKGKARTVFSGSDIEEFDVEILGVLKNWRPGGDLILARASGELIERTGIAAGMSGTPVYVEGKLVGAVAYSWPFSKEPIAGITPISEMLEHGAAYGTEDPEARSDFNWESSGISGAALEEIETPLLISGFHPAVQGIIETELTQYNMAVAQTGSGNEEAGRSKLVPGAALAAQFITGDASASAIGTVTYAEGDKVLGFGHGLFLAGPVEIPMSSAYIHAVLPSLSGSIKLGSASRVIGTITGDGVAGVVGEIGTIPELIPVDVVVRSDRSAPSEFSFGVMRHKLLTPSLAGWVLSSAALTVGGSAGEMTIGVEYTIELDGPGNETRSVGYRDLFFAASPAATIAESLADPLRLLMQNQFEEVRPRSITCRLSIDRSRNVARVEDVYVSSKEVRAGEFVTVTVGLKPYRGEPQLEKFVLSIPDACRAERVKIRVCSAPEMRAWEGKSTSRRLPPRDLEQLISLIASAGRGDRLECVAYVEGLEAGIEGELFPSPPESFSSVVSTPGRAGPVAKARVRVVDAAAVDTGYVIQGCRTVNLELDHGESRR